MRPIRHYLRLGTHAEKDYLLKLRDYFDGLFLNANLVESTSSSLAVFATTLGKPYVIDPITYAFALNPRLLMSQPKSGAAPQLRSTFASLIDRYQLPPDVIGGRPITTTDLASEGVWAPFVDAVRQYQADRLTEAIDGDAAFLTASSIDANLRLAPEMVIAAYFAEERGSYWSEFNRQSINRTLERAAQPVAAMLAYDSSRLSRTEVLSLATAYSQTNVEEIVVWPADLDEHLASSEELNAYADLVAVLASAGKRVIAGFGGFFALSLALRGLVGLSHGIGYGDKRDLQPVLGGGLPPARFYVRAIRDAVPMGDLALLSAKLDVDEFRRRVCDCTICGQLLDAGGVTGLVEAFTETEDRASARGITAVPTRRVYQMSRFHYVLNRIEEVSDLRQAESFNVVRDRLVEDADWVRVTLGSQPVEHIARWVAAADPSRAIGQ